MKLVFYSGGQHVGNHELHQQVIDLTAKRRGVSFTYIPFCWENSESFFRRAIRRYQKFGVSRFDCLCVDHPRAPTPGEVDRALDNDIVYLAGGNTFYFLNWLKKRRMLGRLREYARSGGVVAGLSAGAHIMTPHIGLAGLRGLDPDENDVKLHSLKALGLVKFEFMPHFKPDARKINVLRKYANASGNTIYACADGGGIAMRDGLFTIHGRSWVFKRMVRTSMDL